MRRRNFESKRKLVARRRSYVCVHELSLFGALYKQSKQENRCLVVRELAVCSQV